MENLFRVINLKNSDKVGILDVEAHSNVKSKKYFPIYLIDGKKMIFKPLSKTKPYTTPLFAYSEVYWSYIINKYFDPNAPRYYLATSKGIEEEQPKYFEQGVLVESVNPNDEKMINLYDYFIANPDPLVDITNYINYCMETYDYTHILSSEFIRNNREIGEGLAYQILLSILRQDQNFHYENISFFSNGNSISLVPPIDFEFSTPFLFPDNLEKYKKEQNAYVNSVAIRYEDDEITRMCQKLHALGIFSLDNTIMCNICQIVRLYPEIVSKFIKNLDRLIEELPSVILSDEDNYIGPLNSEYWKVGHACYKENDNEKTEKLKEDIKLKPIDKKTTFSRISADVLAFSKKLSLTLKIYLISYYEGKTDLENLTIREFLNEAGINDDVTIENIDMETKKIMLRKLQRRNVTKVNTSSTE